MNINGILIYLQQLEHDMKMFSIDEKLKSQRYSKYYCLFPIFIIEENARFQL